MNPNLQDSIRSAAGSYYFLPLLKGSLYPRYPWTFGRVAGALGSREKLLILARPRVC